MIKGCEQLRAVFVRILEYLCVFSIAVMAVAVIYQVFSRALGEPSKISEEIATILMIWIGSFGGALGFEKGTHLGIDVLMHVMDKPSQKLMRALTLILVFIFAAAIWLYGGLTITLEAFAEANTLKTMPFLSRGWVYMPLPICGVIVMFFMFNKLLILFQKKECSHE